MQLRAKFKGSSGNTPSASQTDLQPGVMTKGPVPSPAARNLALAHYIEQLIERGVIQDFAQAARIVGVSQPRMSHLMGLLLLAPVIQEAILMGKKTPKDKEMRALARVAEWRTQEDRQAQRRLYEQGES